MSFAGQHGQHFCKETRRNQSTWIGGTSRRCAKDTTDLPKYTTNLHIFNLFPFRNSARSTDFPRKQRSCHRFAQGQGIPPRPATQPSLACQVPRARWTAERRHCVPSNLRGDETSIIFIEKSCKINDFHRKIVKNRRFGILPFGPRASPPRYVPGAACTVDCSAKALCAFKSSGRTSSIAGQIRSRNSVTYSSTLLISSCILGCSR